MSPLFLRFSRQGSFKAASLSGKGFSRSGPMSFFALQCTFSTSCVSVFRCDWIVTKIKYGPRVTSVSGFKGFGCDVSQPEVTGSAKHELCVQRAARKSGPIATKFSVDLE